MREIAPAGTAPNPRARRSWLSLLCTLTAFPLAVIAQPAIDRPLPASLAGWNAAGNATVYQQDSLFDLLDGGAEIYIEYGFVQAARREYGRGSDRLSCTLYQMRNAEAAYGVFSFTRNRQAPVAVGDGGMKSDRQVCFWQGPYFATIEDSSGSAHASALDAIARAVASRLPPQHGSRPAVMSRLPSTGLIPGSEKLLAGRLAVNSLFFLGGGDLFRLESRDRVVYGEYRSAADRPLKLFLALYGDSAKAKAVFAGLEKTLAADRGLRQVEAGPGGQLAWQQRDNYLAVRGGSGWVALAADAPSIADARTVLDRIAGSHR